MKELQEKLARIKRVLTPIQQEYINLRSFENFFQYFNELKEEHKSIVEEMMTEYFDILESNDYLIDKKLSNDISLVYIPSIGKYYELDAGFKLRFEFSSAIFWGLAIDLLLLISGILKDIYYIPVTTLILIIKWLYVKQFYENKNKVFQGRY